MKTNRRKRAKRRTTKRAAQKTRAAPDPINEFSARLRAEGIERAALEELAIRFLSGVPIADAVRVVHSLVSRHQGSFEDPGHPGSAESTLRDFIDASVRMRSGPRRIRRLAPSEEVLDEARALLGFVESKRYSARYHSRASSRAGSLAVDELVKLGMTKRHAERQTRALMKVVGFDQRFSLDPAEQEAIESKAGQKGRFPKLLRDPWELTKKWESLLRPHWKSMQYLGPADRRKGKDSEARKIVREVIAPMIGRTLTSKEEENIARSIWATSKSLGSVALKVAAVDAGTSVETLRSRLTRTP